MISTAPWTTPRRAVLDTREPAPHEIPVGTIYQHFDKKAIIQYTNDLNLNLEEVKYIEKRDTYDRIINILLKNNYFILNNKSIRKLLYSIYLRKCLISSELKCGRMLMVFTKKGYYKEKDNANN